MLLEISLRLTQSSSDTTAEYWLFTLYPYRHNSEPTFHRFQPEKSGLHRLCIWLTQLLLMTIVRFLAVRYGPFQDANQDANAIFAIVTGLNFNHHDGCSKHFIASSRKRTAPHCLDSEMPPARLY